MKHSRFILAILTVITATAFPLYSRSVSATSAHSGTVNLTLVAYSTPKEAYDAIIPAFQKTKAGKNVTFTTSYGPSGDQSRAVANGLPADIVAFSLAPDIDRLVHVHLVSPKWNKNKYRGFVTDSIVVFAVRAGNPKRIHDWSDLVKPGIQVLTPNPFDSGGARWNIMAAYGAQIAYHKTPTQAIDYLRKLFEHVVVQDKSAREELQTFDSGKGDVMLSYENEAITAQRKGEKLEYIIPPSTILIENPVAVTANSKHPVQAAAFVTFLYSKTAQTIFGQKGYRPVVPSVLKTFHYRKPPLLFTIRKLGGWTKVTKKFFDPESGIVTQIERERGVAP
jgi:sulfate/thiosulfate-binding protein